ncbi:MAG: hypothetical protein ACLFUB_10780 [Cyclobacteriaceae bacterium]
MIQTFTLDDVVRYLYDEMNHEEASRLHDAMLVDNELMDSYQQMLSAKKNLEKTSIEKNPSQRSVNRILEYSRTYDLLVEEE